MSAHEYDTPLVEQCQFLRLDVETARAELAALKNKTKDKLAFAAWQLNARLQHQLEVNNQLTTENNALTQEIDTLRSGMQRSVDRTVQASSKFREDLERARNEARRTGCAVRL